LRCPIQAQQRKRIFRCPADNFWLQCPRIGARPVCFPSRNPRQGKKSPASSFLSTTIYRGIAYEKLLDSRLLTFFPIQTSAQGPGVQNGESHFAAGDSRAEEAASVFATNDPTGFTIVDLLMWGSVGHALGYSALASQSFVELLK
tara:strand:+ start:4388 stop:4822 length:435 start_codon:yes stop_codon:yes gene_type:complete